MNKKQLPKRKNIIWPSEKYNLPKLLNKMLKPKNNKNLMSS